MGPSVAIGQSLDEFRGAFPDEASCAAYLFKRRWPDGFVCPVCGGRRYASLKNRAHTNECLDCSRQTWITAGTVMHRSKLPLMVWFSAAHLIATHPAGVSARQLQARLGIAYQTAWLLKQKLRRPMNCRPLEGLVEVNHAKIAFRTAGGLLDRAGSEEVIVAAALEMSSNQIRLAVIPDASAASVDTFVRANVKSGATLLTHSDLVLAEYSHDPQRFEPLTSNTFRWLRRYRRAYREPIEVYLSKFVVYYNDRVRRVSFETVLGFDSLHQPTSYWEIIGHHNPRRGVPTARRKPRRRRTATGMREDGSGPGTALT